MFGFNLEGADFGRADLEGAGVVFCDVSRGNFEMANLVNCNMSQANLTGCNFQHCHCEGAVFNGSRVGGALFDGTYMDGAKSCDKMKEFDPLTWRTRFKLDDGEDDDDNGEGEEGDNKEGADTEATSLDSVSPKKAHERERSLVESKKDKLKDFVVKIIESNVSQNEMHRAILGAGFEVRDIEKVLETISGHTPEDNERSQDYLHAKTRLIASLSRKLQRHKEKAFQGKITVPTINYVNTKGSMLERMKTFANHSRRDPQELRRCVDEIKDVMSQLQEMRGPFLGETWVDQVDEWHELCLLQKGLASERAMSVLRCVFDDKEVIRTLGMAEQLRTIRGKPPQGLMLR